MTGTAWLNILAATLFFSLAVGLAVAIARTVHADAAKQNTLRQEGADTSGLVTEKSMRGRSIRYTFVIDGASYHGRATDVPVYIWDGIHQADSLTIRYLPGKPDVNHPSAWEESTSSTFWLLWMSGFLAIFALFFLRRIPRQRRIAMEGIAVRGTIAEREWRGPSKGQQYVDYTFRNASNDEVEIGRCPCDRYLKGGTTVWVLYLPANPSRSEIYPFEIDFFRIVQ